MLCNLLVVGSYALPPSWQSVYFSYLELLVLSDFSLPSHLFTYSVTYLNKCRLRDICFMFGIYFLAQGASALVPGSFLGGCCVLWPCPQAVTISLLPGDTECSRLILLLHPSSLDSGVSPGDPVPFIKVFVYPYLVANNVIN